jgi:hypothetical protein
MISDTAGCDTPRCSAALAILPRCTIVTRTGQVRTVTDGRRHFIGESAGKPCIAASSDAYWRDGKRQRQTAAVATHPLPKGGTEMSNRRALKPGDTIFVAYGHLDGRDQNYGLPVICFACDTPHEARGLARIEDKSGTTNVPLCEPCLQAEDGDRIVRKYCNASGLEVSEGGEATTEQVLAMAEKQTKTEH